MLEIGYGRARPFSYGMRSGGDMQKSMKLLLLPLVLMFAVAMTIVGRADDTRVLSGHSHNIMSQFVEITDSTGQVVLRGGSYVLDHRKSDVVKQFRAELKSTGIIDEADGLAYIMIDSEDNEIDEHSINVELDDMAANASYDLFINGEKLASVTTDDEGEADIEMKLEND
jgi:hypothetical protein